MQKRTFYVGLAIVTALLVAPLSAQTASVSSYETQVAYAYFYAADPADTTGCLSVWGIISVNSNYLKLPGPSVKPSAGMFLFLGEMDNCTGSWVKFFQDGLPISDFTVGQNSAHVAAQGQMFDQISGTMQTASLDLTWNGVGAPQRQSSVSHGYYPDYGVRALSLYVDLFHNANVTGNITVAGTNFTPDTSWSGYWQTTTQRSNAVQ